MAEQEIQALTVIETLQKTAMSRSSLERLMRRGDFPPARVIVGNKIGFISKDVDQWLLNRPLAK
jgi:predicted DNA-binding transcriptional regulator AlpA